MFQDHSIDRYIYLYVNSPIVWYVNIYWQFFILRFKYGTNENHNCKWFILTTSTVLLPINPKLYCYQIGILINVLFFFPFQSKVYL